MKLKSELMEGRRRALALLDDAEFKKLIPDFRLTREETFAIEMLPPAPQKRGMRRHAKPVSDRPLMTQTYQKKKEDWNR